jgi:hypothetical protein
VIFSDRLAVKAARRRDEEIHGRSADAPRPTDAVRRRVIRRLRDDVNVRTSYPLDTGVAASFSLVHELRTMASNNNQGACKERLIFR